MVPTAQLNCSTPCSSALQLPGMAGATTPPTLRFGSFHCKRLGSNVVPRLSILDTMLPVLLVAHETAVGVRMCR